MCADSTPNISPSRFAGVANRLAPLNVVFTGLAVGGWALALQQALGLVLGRDRPGARPARFSGEPTSRVSDA